MVWNPDPELINLFGLLSIRYYGLSFVIGFALAYYWVWRQYQLENLSTDHLEPLLLHIVLGTVVGARLGHCLFYEPAYYLSHPMEMILPISIGEGGVQFIGYKGLASHGGAVGVLLSLIWFSPKNKRALLPLLDKLAVAIPLTGAFIRLGNFMNSEIIGKASDGPFAVVFSRVDLVPRHPAQLYEATVYILLFFTLRWVYQKSITFRNDKGAGLVFSLFLILLFSSRIFLETFKINQVGFEANIIGNMGQWLSIPFVLAGLVILGKQFLTSNSIRFQKEKF